MKWIYGHPALYDFTDTFISLSLSDRVRRKVLKGLVADSFLEIGAGSGKNFGLLTSPVKIGVDVSEKMLRYAGSAFPGVILIMGDAHSLPLQGACVDVAMFSYCLRGLARPAAAVKEALRVSSTVIIVDYNRPAFVPRAVWEKVINRFGWAVFGSRDLDFDALERLGASSEVTDLYGGLYRVIILRGAGFAQD
jgi:ubiquinone/menaquinone biosynthesis C-methylase UbiE